MQMERSSSKRKYKNSRYETYFFICGFCMILIILIYGITTIFKELHEKNVKEKELESTIVKLRDALDQDFSSFRNDMSNKISGLREDFEVSQKLFGKAKKYNKNINNVNNEKKYDKNNNNKGDRKISGEQLPCLLVHSSSQPSFRICTLDPTVHKVSKLIHTSGHLELVSHWPLNRLLQGIDDPLVVDVGSGLGYLALQACSLGARVISVEENLMLANSIGLIDAGYRGELLVRFNYTTQPEDLVARIHGHQAIVPMFTKVNMDKIYTKGERIAQLVIAETHSAEFEIVEELSDTDRGKGGFGSTGA